MSAGELDRAMIIDRVIEHRLSRVEAARQLGLTPRHMGRLIKAYRERGASALISKKRGKRSNRAYPSAYKAVVLEIVREHYNDFGPTLATEKLSECHNIHLSDETLRLWMIEADLWQTRSQKAKRAYQPRYRRECYGELIQIDGSEHYWFEDRGPKCTLLVYVDDATGTLMELRFAASESTFDYFYSTQRYLERHGKPVAFYSDKHTVFRVNQKEAKSGTGLTQFGRALHELNIDIIYAHSSQAKGRVERMNQTLQDRLVKELRLAGISTIEAANNFLPVFVETFNERFAKAPLRDTNMHRPLTEIDDLEEILCFQEQRTVSNSLSLQYDKVLYLLEDNEFTRTLRRKRVTVCDYPDGTIGIKYDGQSLPFSVFDKIGHIRQADIVDNKRLGAALAFIHEKQKELNNERSAKAPKRRGQKLISAEMHRQKNPALV